MQKRASFDAKLVCRQHTDSSGGISLPLRRAEALTFLQKAIDDMPGEERLIAYERSLALKQAEQAAACRAKPTRTLCARRVS